MVWQINIPSAVPRLHLKPFFWSSSCLLYHVFSLLVITIIIFLQSEEPTCNSLYALGSLAALLFVGPFHRMIEFELAESLGMSSVSQMVS